MDQSDSPLQSVVPALLRQCLLADRKGDNKDAEVVWTGQDLTDYCRWCRAHENLQVKNWREDSISSTSRPEDLWLSHSLVNTDSIKNIHCPWSGQYWNSARTAATKSSRVKSQPTDQCQSSELGDHHNLSYPIPLCYCYRWIRADLPQYGPCRIFHKGLILDTES